MMNMRGWNVGLHRLLPVALRRAGRLAVQRHGAKVGQRGGIAAESFSKFFTNFPRRSDGVVA
jgi:hypothetical protein